ncbi:hypothetical protein LEP1GSC173_4368 [Leptospira interrogans str. HAI1594]|uniref:Uncharacterized protein n=1 Tax=Leptospira interrogans str. UI 12621 TaxID=1049937 RepID=A0A0F6HE65_LEPIR|nr:hypothetical protein LEP1GSC104_4040 [Leptospira interrogans str. UI 12621]EKP77381.1 hypothetical protein LEP1GSC173_4368 [Leptospira interrogans str. HAI1594]EKP87044.1 hypothetical protein LEP1GSC020_2863 [Leptospira interrogans serovar Grippotyphosa str. 2006006986]EKR82473.1 hypothetical protein LEP1GSC099_3802 [Leptospira interrogans str. UI 08452]EMN07076.1 hypothetical protein LEP1GSC053_3034 [Leptospira interrogans serovar Muenchen str. Brem 129]EMO18132.1 hypothetical protein LEP1
MGLICCGYRKSMYSIYLIFLKKIFVLVLKFELFWKKMLSSCNKNLF